jgi:hypothetical protein
VKKEEATTASATTNLSIKTGMDCTENNYGASETALTKDEGFDHPQEYS